MRQIAIFALSTVLTLAAAGTANATSIAFDLNCVLGQTTGGSVQCGVPSYGTITLDDSPGNGDILLTVNLAGTGAKFKDLFLNYGGSAAEITAGDDDDNVLDPDSVSHSPYTGLFDVGGFKGNDGYSVVLHGWNGVGGNVALTLLDFQEFDSWEKTYVSLHVQNLDCPTDGPLCTSGGAMNAVGSAAFGDPTRQQITAEAPEPASLLLFGTGLIAAAMRGRRRTRR